MNTPTTARHGSGDSRSWLALGGMVVCMTSAQLLFKSAGLQVGVSSNWLQGLAINPPLWMGLAASAAGMLCWVRALRGLALPVAYPWTAVISLTVPLCSMYFFAESLGPHYFAGMVLVAIGIFLTAGGARSR